MSSHMTSVVSLSTLQTKNLSLLGYSNGDLGDVTQDSIHSGGECDRGLKLVLVIGRVQGEDSGGPTVQTPEIGLWLVTSTIKC